MNQKVIFCSYCKRWGYTSIVNQCCNDCYPNIICHKCKKYIMNKSYICDECCNIFHEACINISKTHKWNDNIFCGTCIYNML